MTRDELKRLIVGPIATVPTPFDDDFEVDHGRMAAETQYWVESGLVTGQAVIKVAAAMGEGPMLSDDEWPHLLRTTVQAAQGKAAIVCGIHYKNTKRTIEDAKKAQDLGAIGLQISPPIFNLPTQDDLLRYYGAVSDAIAIGIMVYCHPWMRGGDITAETIRRMANFEQVVAIKWAVADEADYDEMKTFAGTFNVIDNSSQPVRCYQNGGRGYINMTAEIYPLHDLKIWQLLEAKKYDEAQALFEPVNTTLRDFFVNTSTRSGGQARVKKGLAKLMGHPMGDSRPPLQPLNEVEMTELRDILVGLGWPVAS